MPEYISENYRQLNADLHKTRPIFGSKSFKWGRHVLAVLGADPGIETILDYGAGKGTLGASLKDKIQDLKLEWREYDPAIPGIDKLPEPADLVVCTDVIEHIEPEYIDNVLKHLRTLAKRKLLLTISFMSSGDILPDGSNAHRIVMNEKAWRNKLIQAGFSFDGAEYSASATEMLVCLRS